MSAFGTKAYYQSPEYLALEPDIIRGCKKLAKAHVASIPEVELLDIDLNNPDVKNLPGLRGYVVDGRPVPYGALNQIGTAVEPTFDELVEGMVNDSSSKEALGLAYGMLSQGKNVAIITNHSTLYDIAVVQGAIVGGLEAIKTDGQFGDEAVNYKRSIVLSKMLSVVGYALNSEKPTEHTPAVRALQFMCDSIYLTFPATHTSRAKGKQIDKQYIKAHNTAVKRAIRTELLAGGVLMAEAPSGSVDEVDKSTGDVMLKPLMHGTADLLNHGDTHYLPVGAWFRDTEEPFIEVCGSPVSAATTSVHGLMRVIANRLEARFGDDRRVKYADDVH